MVTEGDYITYGHYPQTAAGTDSTPIEWLVLKVQDNKALVISRYGLDARAFTNFWYYSGWKSSATRKWLNSTFLNTAFTSEEQQGIVTTKVSTQSYSGYSGGSDTEDQLWLLSRDEATTYFTSDEARKCIPTAYAMKHGASQSRENKLNGTGCCWWWLRSPGDYNSCASCVSSGGSLRSDTVDESNGSVRPAFWLNLDYAGIQATMSDTIAATPTPTPTSKPYTSAPTVTPTERITPNPCSPTDC